MTVWQELQLVLGLRRVVNDAEAKVKELDPMNSKSLFSSKTFWFNVVAGGIGFAQAQGLFTLVPEPYAPLVVMVANLALRFVTTQPVTVLGQ